ncbi:MAG: response regulator [Proteobacteria bacterium]|nr:response regulator [Pseudomonadota bacterium]
MIDLQDMSVLIVDDMENMCKSIRAMLKVLNFGKRFRVAHNGREALKILKEGDIDLAIIDWNMPIMTGVELLVNIREDKNLRDTPVVMITAEANREIVAEAGESDIDAYILKPLTVKSIGDKIVNVIDRTNNPSPMMLYLKKSRVFEETGDLDAAIEEAKLALKADPNSSRPVRVLGQLYYKKQDIDIAEKCFLKAIKMNKLDVFAYHHLGEISLKKNNIEKAETYFDKAMSISPRHVSRGIYFGKILVQKKKFDKAKKVFSRTLKFSEDPMPLREELIDFCIQNVMYDFAKTLIEELLRQLPTRTDMEFKLGLVYLKIGESKKALEHFLIAEKQDTQNFEVKLHIAKLYIEAGQIFRADQALSDVLRLDPGNSEAKSLLQDNI